MVTDSSGVFTSISSEEYDSFMNIEIPPLALIALALILV